MKIRKQLFLFLLILFPMMVHAEDSSIEIKSITLKDSSDHAFEKEEVSFHERDIYLNLQMSEKNDFVEYKMILKNTSNEDLEMNVSNSTSEYLKYSITPKDNSNTIKKNSEKEVLLKIEYINKVPNGSFNTNDELEQTINLGLQLTHPKNPKTGRNTWLIILPILLLLLGLYTMKDQKRLSKKYLLLGIICLLSYNIVNASKNDITIHSNVTLANYHYVYTGNAYGLGSDDYIVIIGERIAPGITQYDNPQDAIDYLNNETNNSRYNVFFRHKMINNVVVETDIGYLYNDNYYYLKGAGATYDNSTNTYRNDSLYYEDNTRIMNQLFNRENCYTDIYGGIEEYYCLDEGKNASITNTGVVYIVVRDTFKCNIEYEKSYCFFLE